MTSADIRAAARAWLQANRRKIIVAVVLLALGFAAGSVFAHDKPPPAPPAPTPVIVQAAEPHANRCIDKWKCDHFLASGVLGVAAGRAIDDGTKWQWADRELNCGVQCQRWSACLAPGIAKELHDQYRWRTGSWKDMAANTLGCALGLHLSTRF